MNKEAVKIIADGLATFQPKIRFQIKGTVQVKELLKQAIILDPVNIYFLSSFQVNSWADHYELQAKYSNKDTAHSDIQIISSVTECVELMCNFVGGYKKKMPVVSIKRLDTSRILDLFHEMHSSFYPNLTSTQVNSKSYFTEYMGYDFVFQYRLGQVKLLEMEQEVDKEVERISAFLFKPSMPAETKIYLAHNYLASTVTYFKNDSTRTNESYTQSAYGALIKKRCVCQGYAEAFKRLMDAAGIECFVIYGKTDDEPGYHAWNIVSPGKGSDYYHIDVTWDSTDGILSFDYFCKNDAFFKGKRTWNKKYYKTCNGSAPILYLARKYIMINKAALLLAGLREEVLGC